MRTIFALFGKYHEAASAVEALLARGFGGEAVNVIVQAPVAMEGMETPPGPIRGGDTRITERQRLSPMDMLLTRSKPVAVAGGEVYAAGATAGRAAAGIRGDLPGGLALALVGLGVPDELANLYGRGVAEGGVLVWVSVEEGRFAEASEVLAGPTERKVANFD